MTMAHDFTAISRLALAQAHPTARPLWGIVLDRGASGAAEQAESSLRLLADAALAEAVANEGTGMRVVGVVVTETGDLTRFDAWGVDL